MRYTPKWCPRCGEPIDEFNLFFPNPQECAECYWDDTYWIQLFGF